ncbi:PepSY-associated TM helix domain-containing protein [Herbaspirillum sp. alder98]|uniref:PepSY-associated TM helix domain-containing protein n=1 Tax=Herbaspirillum sp. alder98 TaxID=2913096 RepID=UPI001CD8BCD3|nr:PepSY-associated TM helix domain-containing protein [Herbaspirillum sp. alder98]MCA1325862.1 PepSY domain-containing protein [Herbaspirillum sp. alder98]
MKSQTLRGWYAVHRWTSLACTANLLLLCITGLILIFHHEIDHLLEQEPAVVKTTSEAPRPSLQQLADAALAAHPGTAPKSITMFEDDGVPMVGVRVGAPGVASLREGTSVFMDTTNGAIRALFTGDTFTGFILKLHVNLFLGFPGQLFIGAVGLVFFLSMLSGIVLYGPFMRKLAFGLVRFGRQTRIVQADLHNLTGIVVMVWALVVGLTGSFLSFSPLIIGLWQKTELSELIRNLPAAPPKNLVPLDKARRVAELTVPGKDLAYIFYPGSEYATQRHYMVVLRGHTEIEKRVFNIVVVDAETGALAAQRSMPWYMQVLLLSGPFHFGDYGGLPLKILWALLTILTTAATVTGLVIWSRRSKTAMRQIDATATNNTLKEQA